MDKRITLDKLNEKAGYYGSLEEVENNIKMTRYQSIKLFMTYDKK